MKKKYAESELKSANLRVTTLFSKYQANVNESIIFYKKIANDLLIDENSHQLEYNLIYSIASASFGYKCFIDRYHKEKRVVWVFDEFSTNYDIVFTNKDIEKQLIALSHLIPNLDTIFYNAYIFIFFILKK